jgi:hypothetical protein
MVLTSNTPAQMLDRAGVMCQDLQKKMLVNPIFCSFLFIYICQLPELAPHHQAWWSAKSQ